MREDVEPDTASYGSLLGDYFATVRTIGEMEEHFDAEELEENETYARLLTQREDLHERLDAVARSRADSDIKQLLDEAFAEE